MSSSGNVERRAIQILLSARAVAEDMESYRQHLGSGSLPPAVADLLSDKLEDATGRLSNLISLAIAEVGHSSDQAFRDHFDSLLRDVRGRWVQLHLKKIETRLAYIDRLASDTMSSGIHRLGLARRLEQAYGEIHATLVAMDAIESPGLERHVLEEVLAKIACLAALEDETFRLLDLNRKSAPPR